MAEGIGLGYEHSVWRSSLSCKTLPRQSRKHISHDLIDYQTTLKSRPATTQNRMGGQSDRIVDCGKVEVSYLYGWVSTMQCTSFVQTIHCGISLTSPRRLSELTK